MATHRILIFDPVQDAPARKAAGSLRLAPTKKNDRLALTALSYTTREKEKVMNTFLLIAALAILGFLCFSGPDGFIGPRYRH